MNKFIIYTDGGSRGNPGPGGAGVVFCNQKGDTVDKFSKFLGEKITNNEAEYGAVIFALEKFKSKFGKKLAKEAEIEIKADSELVVKQMNREYKIEKEELQKLFVKLHNLTLDFKKVRFKAVKRDKNKEADRLANKAMDSENSLF